MRPLRPPGEHVSASAREPRGGAGYSLPMDQPTHGLPAHYATATRTLLRYAVAMTLFALLSGVLFHSDALSSSGSMSP